MRKRKEHPNQSIVYISPTLITPDDLNETISFFEEFCDPSYAPFKNQNYQNIIESFFFEQKLRLIREYEFKDIEGFACESDNPNNRLRYIFIRNSINKLRILKYLLKINDFDISQLDNNEEIKKLSFHKEDQNGNIAFF